MQHSSKISAQSQRRSQCRSLQRPSWSQASIDHHHSLIYVMSIEGSIKSDIYEQMLLPQKNLPNYRISNGNGENQSYVPYNRQSDINRPKIYHICGCYAQCDRMQCPCYEAKNQLCIKDYCCITCIKLKNAMMQNIRLNQGCHCKNTKCLKQYCKCFQMNGYCTEQCKCEGCLNSEESTQRWQVLQIIQKQNNNWDKYCTCKKTKCNKKYCSCFSSGMKCSNLCSCVNCINCQQQQLQSVNYNMPIQENQYYNIEEQLVEDNEISNNMEFEPVNFSGKY